MDDHFAKDIRYHAAIAHEYDSVITEPRAFPNDLLFGALDPLIAGGSNMLDLGCGTGQMLMRYGARYANALGVDHSPQMLGAARSNLERRGLTTIGLVQSDLAEFLARDDTRYDLVTCVGCLHHFPHDQIGPLLASVSSRLSRDGVFLFAEPIEVDISTLPAQINAWNADSIMRERGYSADSEDPDEGPLPMSLLDQSLESAGLKLVAHSRGWEIFPHALPLTLADRIGLWQLHHRFGASGNIFAAVACRK